uniref:Uncharacterized protein n=1 Tax=Picea sitchensis TaxID=3332 RepID=A9NYD1_PICSI|nr:unknown [Picea sitchensis]
MVGAGKYASAAFLVVVLIMMMGAAAAAEVAEVKAAAPSPTMEAGTASMPFLPSPFAALIASFIPFFLACRLY